MTKDIELRPTIVSRLVLGMVAMPIASGFAFADRWITAGAIAAVFALACWAITRGRFVIDDRGVRVRGVLGESALAWENISHYTYWSGPVRISFVASDDPDRQIDGPLAGASLAHHRLVVHGRAKKLALTSWYRDAGRGTARIVDELHRRLANAPSFLPFAIAEEGLRHGDKLLAWPRVEGVRLRGYPSRLDVMKWEKAFPWASCGMKGIHNGLLFLERIAERGIPVDLGPKQLVTERLIAAVHRQASLPQARVERGGRGDT